MVQPVGTITLFVLTGRTPFTAFVMVDFLVVKAPSLYNAILGKLTLNNLRAVTSTFYLKMKFPTPQGVGEIQKK